MRKQTKIAAVVSAAALLALGASMTSFAVSKGTCTMVDGEWYCYDKNGDAYTNTFCSSNGKEYYVGDDGQLVRSEWVEDGSDKYFVNGIGAKITNDWRLTTPYDDETADEEWYYLKKTTGKPATGKQANVNGQIYLFDSDGRMLYGWVANTSTGSNANYEQIDLDDSTHKKSDASDYTDVYYCGDEDDGHAKKNKWTKTWLPSDTDEEEDYQKWFWFDKNGKLYKTTSASNVEAFEFKDGLLKSKKKGYVSVSKKKVNGKDYWFDEEGAMLSKFYLVNSGAGNKDFDMYYFGGSDDSSMKTGSQSIRDDAGDTFKFYFTTKGDKKGAGIIGNQGGKLYYFGMLIQADDYRYQIATITDKNNSPHSFIVNANSSIQHSYKTQYKEDGDVLIETYVSGTTKFETTKGAYENEITGDYFVKSDLPGVKIDDHVNTVDVIKTK